MQEYIALRHFKRIRKAQAGLMKMLTSEEYNEGKMSPEDQAKLDQVIYFCAAYEDCLAQHTMLNGMTDADRFDWFAMNIHNDGVYI